MFASGPLTSPPSVAQSQSVAIAQPLPAFEDFYAEVSDSWGDLKFPDLGQLDQLIDQPITAVADVAIATVGAVGMFTAILGNAWKWIWDPKK